MEQEKEDSNFTNLTVISNSFFALASLSPNLDQLAELKTSELLL